MTESLDRAIDVLEQHDTWLADKEDSHKQRLAVRYAIGVLRGQRKLDQIDADLVQSYGTKSAMEDAID